MLKFLLCHIHFIQSYYNNGAIFSVYWLGPQTKIFPSSWFCLKEALATVHRPRINNLEISMINNQEDWKKFSISQSQVVWYHEKVQKVSMLG